MHFNRKKISGPNLRISPRGGKKKKVKKTIKVDETPIKVKKSISHPKRIKKNVNIVSSALKKSDLEDRKKYKPLSEWNNLLKEHTVFILGNSPSISKIKLSLLDNYFTIGVNRIFYLYAPTILMWQDIELWNTEKKRISKQKSIRLSNVLSDPKRVFLNFKVKQGGFKFGNNPKILHGWGNTTALSVQLSINLGCSKIVLLGTDCKYKGKKTDFYGVNRDHKPHTLEMCKDALKWIKKDSPVPIYNCSENKTWEKMGLKEVISKIKPVKMNRKKYLEIFKK
jgi:hypothetical protein